MNLEIVPLMVILHIYADVPQAQDACEKLGAGRAPGCAVVRGNHCEVHVSRPQAGYARDFIVIGEEFWHCRYPHFHG